MRGCFAIILSLFTISGSSQTGLFVNGPGASLRVDSSAFISIEGDFQNLDCDPVRQTRINGIMYLSGGLANNDSLKFSALSSNSRKGKIVFNWKPNINSSNIFIVGSALTQFWAVEINKPPGGTVFLGRNISSQDTIDFIQGNIALNGYKWTLKDPEGAPSIVNHPWIKNERQGSCFIAVNSADTGQVIYRTIYTNSMSINPANIGISFTGTLDIGSQLYIKRGYTRQLFAGKTSVNRYYDINSPGHPLSATSVMMRYSLLDLTYLGIPNYNLNALTLFTSPQTDMDYSQVTGAVQNTAVTTVIYDGAISANLSPLIHPNINLNPHSFRLTIADPSCTLSPVSPFSNDTIHICTGNTIVLDGGNNTAIPNTSLKWEWITPAIFYTRTVSIAPSGLYKKVRLILKDVRGCLTRDTVLVAPAAPYPQITYLNHLNSCLADSVIIKDTVKIATGTYSNNWQFSDGGTGTYMQNQFKRKFSSAGTFSMQLTATSNRGCSVMATSANIIVYPPPIASFTHSYNCTTSNVHFSNTSMSNHTALTVSSYTWNFAPGTSTVHSPVHFYTTSGTYPVKLKISSSFGCKDSVTQNVVVHPKNQVSFVKNNACLGDTVYYTNTSVCNTGSCSYTFVHDGSILNGLTSYKKRYTVDGMIIAKLSVTSPVGCPDSVSSVIFIHPVPIAQYSSSSPKVCQNETVYFSNYSSISSGSITGYLWDFNNSVFSSSVNGSQSYSLPGDYTVSLTATSDSGCVNSNFQIINVKQNPVASVIIPSVCYGTPSQFISSGNFTFYWDYGNGLNSRTLTADTHTYTYPSAGEYSASVIVKDNWNCSDTAFAIAQVFQTPVLNLGNNIITCGNSYIFDAGNSGASFLWSPGNQTTQTISVSSSGLYSVVVTATNGCSDSSSVQLTLNSIVKPQLGNDTTICGAYLLDAGYPGGSYIWNTSAISQTILAMNSGSFVVTVTDINSCTGSDTIQLNVLQPATVHLGPDLNICRPPTPVILNPATNGTSFLWSTGSGTSNFSVSSAGTYWLEVTALNGCKARDSVIIQFKPTPVVALGENKTSCNSILLDAFNAGNSFIWNSGETSQSIVAAASGSYWVQVTNTVSGCSAGDTLQITIHPPVILDLGPDMSFCSNVIHILDAGNPNSDYEWTTGAGTRTLAITTAGLYGVKVTSAAGCSATDYIQLTMKEAPEVELGHNTMYLCGQKPLLISHESQGTARWGKGDQAISTSTHVTIQNPGKFWLSITSNGCSASDTVMVIHTNNTVQASFLASTVDTVNKPVQFVNLSSPEPITQVWHFGDGNSSTDKNPVHTYVPPQDFSVTLEVTNGYCTDRLTKTLNVLFREAAKEIERKTGLLELVEFTVYPNPVKNELKVKTVMSREATSEIAVYDLNGRLLNRAAVEKNDVSTSVIGTDQLSNGIYLLKFTALSEQGALLKTVRFVKAD